MRYFKLLFVSLLLQLTTVFGQEATRHAKGEISSKYEALKYDIINIDTLVFHYVSGDYNSPNFKQWDSTKVWAHIILKNAPKVIDSVILKLQIKAIMKRHGISKASVFRDEYSSELARLSSAYAYKKLIGRQGYFGIFSVD